MFFNLIYYRFIFIQIRDYVIRFNRIKAVFFCYVKKSTFPRAYQSSYEIIHYRSIMVRRIPKTMIISKVRSNGCRLVIFYWDTDLFVLLRCINYSLVRENHTHCTLPCYPVFSFFLGISYSF